jgi:hypothetical protein
MLGQIVPATRSHAIQMAPHMRDIEVIEVMDAVGLEPEAALLREIDRSASAWAWIVDGDVACMFGVVQSPNWLDHASYPWFLTTPLVKEHARPFARACKTLLPELLARHPVLVGMVDARYTLSVRWLQWLGARLDDPQPWGVAQERFRRFVIGE